MSGTASRAGRAADAAGFVLGAGSTTRFAVGASTSCADGTRNIRSTSSLGTDAKPLVLALGGHDATGLDQLFPRLLCAGPVVVRVG